MIRPARCAEGELTLPAGGKAPSSQSPLTRLPRRTASDPQLLQTFTDAVFGGKTTAALEKTTAEGAPSDSAATLHVVCVLSAPSPLLAQLHPRCVPARLIPPHLLRRGPFRALRFDPAKAKAVPLPHLQSSVAFLTPAPPRPARRRRRRRVQRAHVPRGGRVRRGCVRPRADPPQRLLRHADQGAGTVTAPPPHRTAHSPSCRLFDLLPLQCPAGLSHGSLNAAVSMTQAGLPEMDLEPFDTLAFRVKVRVLPSAGLSARSPGSLLLWRLVFGGSAGAP